MRGPVNNVKKGRRKGKRSIKIQKEVIRHYISAGLCSRADKCAQKFYWRRSLLENHKIAVNPNQDIVTANFLACDCIKYCIYATSDIGQDNCLFPTGISP